MDGNGWHCSSQQGCGAADPPDHGCRFNWGTGNWGIVADCQASAASAIMHDQAGSLLSVYLVVAIPLSLRWIESPKSASFIWSEWPRRMFSSFKSLQKQQQQHCELRDR